MAPAVLAPDAPRRSEPVCFGWSAAAPPPTDPSWWRVWSASSGAFRGRERADLRAPCAPGVTASALPIPSLVPSEPGSRWAQARAARLSGRDSWWAPSVCALRRPLPGTGGRRRGGAFEGRRDPASLRAGRDTKSRGGGSEASSPPQSRLLPAPTPGSLFLDPPWSSGLSAPTADPRPMSVSARPPPRRSLSSRVSGLTRHGLVPAPPRPRTSTPAPGPGPQRLSDRPPSSPQPRSDRL